MSLWKVCLLRKRLDGALLTGRVPTEELSEEDQNLKNELEMLVARLHVYLQLRLLQSPNPYADRCPFVGTRYQPIHTCLGCHQGFH